MRLASIPDHRMFLNSIVGISIGEAKITNYLQPKNFLGSTQDRFNFRLYHGCNKDVSRMYQGCIKDISTLYKGFIKDLPRKYQGCIKAVSMLYL